MMPKPDPEQFERARRRLRKFLRMVIAEHRQIMRDVAYWNQHRTDAAPLDSGGDLVVVKMAEGLLERVEAGQPLPDKEWNDLIAQMERNAEAPDAEGETTEGE